MRATALVLLAFAIRVPAFGQPAISSLSPTNVTVGSPSFQMTVTGTGFTSTNIVQWDGLNQPTTFVSATQLQASVAAAQVATQGTHGVRVRASAIGPIFSNVVNFDVDALAPTLTSINPTSAFAGALTFTVTATGTNYEASSVVRWNGVALTTSFNSSTSLTATVPASFVAAIITANVTVHTPAPGGGNSGSRTFNVVARPVPTLTSISPTSTNVDTSPTVSFTGTNFVPSSIARLGGVDLATTFVSSTHIQGVLPASMTAAPGNLAAEVTTPAPGGGTASGPSLVVVNPVPGIGQISPSHVVTGGPAFTLTVNGTNLNGTTQVLIDGTPVPTTPVSSTQVTAQVVAAQIATGGQHEVRTNNSPGGGTSQFFTYLAVANPAPVLTSITPQLINAGGANEPLTLSGTGLVGESAVVIGGFVVPVSSIGPGQIGVLVPKYLLAATANLPIYVSNAPVPNLGANGGTSVTLQLGVSGPAVTGVSPVVVPVLTPASAPITLTVAGPLFAAGDVVSINGRARATTFVNGSQLTCTVDGTLQETLHPGGFSVTVVRQGSAGLASSNASEVVVGAPGFPDNLGTVVLSPVVPGPGDEVVVRVEVPVAGNGYVPITLVVDTAAPAPFIFNQGPTFDIAVAPGLGAPIVMVDGLGLFGFPMPASVSSVTSEDLSSLGGPGVHGSFRSPPITLPPFTLGITVSLAAFYTFSVSPFLVGSTHICGPYSL